MKIQKPGSCICHLERCWWPPCSSSTVPGIRGGGQLGMICWNSSNWFSLLFFGERRKQEKVGQCSPTVAVRPEKPQQHQQSFYCRRQDSTSCSCFQSCVHPPFPTADAPGSSSLSQCKITQVDLKTHGHLHSRDLFQVSSWSVFIC